MNEQTVEKDRLQWHQAFYAGLQIELEKEADKLIFENEHQLSTEPMEIDVLVIKKDTEERLQKNIGKIFRKYNIIEYKSPEDYVSIDDFYKVYGYCCFYKADTPNINFIKVHELTISFVCNRYPGKLAEHLRRIRGYVVEREEHGIYQVKGDIIPIQIIVTKELPKEENLWLKSLTDQLDKSETIEDLLDSYKNNYKNPLYKSVMNLIVRANRDVFKEEDIMCEALEELWKDKIDEIVEERARERAREIAEERAKIMAEERAKIMAEERAKIMAEERAKAIAEERLNEMLKEQINMAEMKIVNLAVTLLKQGRSEDIVRAAEDRDYQEQLLDEFGL